MDNEEYFVLARLIRDRLLELDLDEIAEFSNYMEDEGEDRLPPDGKSLVRGMLRAFDRYLAVNALETVEESLRIIGHNIDRSELDIRALVHPTNDGIDVVNGRDIAEPVPTLGNMSEVRNELAILEALLLEDAEDLGPDRGIS